MWIRKGDKVLVITGNERGKVGEVIAKRGDRVVVQGINIRKKHAKRAANSPAPGVLEMEMSMHISNVSLCNDAGKAIKPKVRQDKEGHRELFYVENGKEVTLRQIKKHS
jgi:large subunit ribosomal protein L24